MAEVQRNVPILNRKEWQSMMAAPTATVAAAFVIADNSGEQDFALYMASNTVHYLYNHKEDDWLQIPSGAFAVALSAGACGAYLPWSVAYTATGGTDTTVNVSAASFNINGFVIGKTIEFLTGTSANIGLRRTVLGILTDSGTGTITITLDIALPSAVANADTFRIKSGSFFVLNAGTLAATNYFKRFDMGTLVWTNLAVTGLPATWGTDGKLVSPYLGTVSYDSGTATSGSSTTLVKTGAGWGVNQWVNYQVRITAGTGVGQIRVITANTSTQLTFAAGATIDATSQFVIEGDENAIYAMGNNAVTLYKYSISGNTTATVSPSAARAGAPVAGMTACFVGVTGNATWALVSGIKNGRYIYSLRGGASTILDRYDIATLAWLPTTGVVYVNTLITFATGTSMFWDKEFLYIAKEGSASVPQRFYKYSVTGNTLDVVTTDWYLNGAAVLGNKIWLKNLSSQGVIKWLYCLGATSTNLRRIMIY